MTPPSQIDHDHEKIVDKLENMNSGIRESLKAIHEDIRKVIVEVNGKYDELRDELHEQRIARTKLEGRIDLIQKTSNENEALWKKVIYTGIGVAVAGVLAGLAKIGGAW